MIAQDNLIHSSIIQRFAKLQEKDRLAHAYLFIGPKDIGKGETAIAIAKMVNCEKHSLKTPFCDQCASCAKINCGNHPDIHVTTGEFGETIKIDQVRELLDQIKLRPFMAEKKVFIIKNVETLTAEGSNALLKTLEEPNANSLLILTTSTSDKILDTVKSRCHSVVFLPSSKMGLASDLTKYYDMDASGSQFLSFYAEGCFGKAKKLNEAKIIRRKNDFIDQFILSRNSEAFIKDVIKDDKGLKEFLNILLSWVRDAILIKSGVGHDSVMNVDRIKELRHFQGQYTFEDLKDLEKEVVKTHQLLADNLNIKLPLFIIKEKLTWGKP